MKILLLIGTGSFIGGVLRYMISQLIQQKFLAVFPFGTLGVNIIGCFAIGVIFAMSERTAMSTEWRLFLATGICGGFTTFSAFSNDALGLLRDGQYFYTFAYVSASVLLGLLSTFIGFTVLKFF